MQRFITRQFRDNILTPQSELIDIKHIGPYLYRRLKQEFASRARTISIRSFARKIENLQLDNLKRKLQKALQNQHNNQCITIPGYEPYHVADVNEKGYEAMISLIKVLERNADGYGLGRNFVFDASRLRMPPKRSTISKNVSCLNRNNCAANGGVWHNRLCQPPSNARGFAGVYPYSGQKTKSRNQRASLGSINNSIRRGRYVRSPNRRVEWRRPGRMSKV